MEKEENKHFKWAYSRNTIDRHHSETENGINNRKEDLMLMISRFSPTGYKYKSISRNQLNDQYNLYKSEDNGILPTINANISTRNESQLIYKGIYY